MNKEITLIDLLDMDAEGEERPNKIKFEDNTYKLTDYGYEAENGDELYGLINFDGSNLNSTVEIIEDNDKLEKINVKTGDNCKRFIEYDDETGHHKYTIRLLDEYFSKNINKIIDHINKIEEEMRK